MNNVREIPPALPDNLQDIHPLRRRRPRRITSAPLLPREAQPAVLAALQADAPAAYAIIPQGEGYHAVNPAQQLDITFQAESVSVQSQRADTWVQPYSLRLVGYGSRGAETPLPAAETHVQHNRLEYRRGSLTEWYINGPLGLEQGFTLYVPPPTGESGPVVLRLAYPRTVSPALSADGQALTFAAMNGGATVTYGHLYATDAQGHCLPVHLELERAPSSEASHIHIVVDTTDALYPILVDPLFEQQQLVGNDVAGSGDLFGYATAISSDGKTLLISAYNSGPPGSSQVGSAYIFQKSGMPSVWRQSAEVTAGADAGNGDLFGAYIGIDGDSAIIGCNRVEKPYIFVRNTDGTWPSTPTLKLSPPMGSSGFGDSGVAISGDTILVCASSSNSGDGLVYAYVRKTDNSWPTSPSYTLGGTPGSGEAFGYYAVAISGSTAVIGAHAGYNGYGRAYVFVRKTDGSWPSSGTKIQSSDLAQSDLFGTDIGINGNTVVVGAAAHTGAGGALNGGKAYVFTRNTDGSWPTTESQQLVPMDNVAGDYFGSNVAISGNTLVVGAPGKNNSVGIAYVYSRNGTAASWSQQNTLQPSDGAPGDGFGSGSGPYQVELATNASTVIVGKDTKNNADGTSYVFNLVTTASQPLTDVLIASANGSVGHLSNANTSTPTYQPLLTAPVGLGTAIKLIGDVWTPGQVLLLGSSSLQYCSDITAPNPTWQTAVSSAVGETYIADMQGSLKSPNYFCWLSKKSVSGTYYVFYNYTTDFFATTHSLQVAHYNASLTYGITLSAFNDGNFWVTAGDPSAGDAGVYPITGGNTLGTMLTSPNPTVSTYGGPLVLPYSLLGGAGNANDVNLTVFTGAATASTNATTYGVGGSTNTIRPAGQLVSNQALNSFVPDGAFLNAAYAMTFILSNDGGATWTTSAVPTFGRASPSINSVMSWLDTPDYVAIGGSNVLAVTTDRGTTWTDLWPFLPGSVQASAVVTVMPDPLLVGTLKEPTNTGTADCPVCQFGRVLLGNPLEARHGDKSEEVTDLSVQTAAGSLAFTRTYRQTKLSTYQVVGLGWTHNQRPYLDLSALPNTITMQLSNSGDVRFTLSGSNHFVAEPGSGSVIDYSAGTTQYTLTAPDKTLYVFDSSGKLLSRTWPSGELWSYSYTSGKLTQVSDAYGRGLQLTYISNPGQFNDGQLWRVGDLTATGLSGATPAGRYVGFTYTTEKLNGAALSSPKALLLSVRDVLGNVWSYDYYGQHTGETDSTQQDFLTRRLTPIVDSTGAGAATSPITLESLSYTLSNGAISQVVQSRGNALQQTTYAFQLSGRNVTTETTAGRSITHHFFGGVYAGPQDPAGNARLQVNSQQYRPTAQVDARGNATLLKWSANGQQLQKVVDAQGRLTQFTYNNGGATDNTLASSVDAQGRTTKYTYADANNPRIPTQVQVYDTDGRTLLRWQKFSYDNRGRTLSEQTLDPTAGTLQQQVTRTYYTAGNGAGLLRQVTQQDLVNPANTTTTTYFYDSAGRVIRTNQSATFGSCTSSFTLYDLAGNVLASVCNYNPGEAPDPTTVAGVLALYNLALPDQNRITTYAYDSLGRRISTTANAGSAGAVTNLTVYDGLNRVVRTITNYMPSQTIPNPYVHARADFNHGPNNDQNLVTDTVYNERGLTRTQTDVLGHVTLYGYDLADRLVKTVQNASQPTYDNSYTTGDPSLGKYIPGGAPDQDVITTTSYDPNGNAVATTDALGNVTLTGFDPLNRVVRTIRSASQPNYNWAADPTLSAYVPSSAPDKDLIDYTEYDALGHVTRTRDSLGNWTLYGYDGLGRQVKTIRNASQPNYGLAADPPLAHYTPSPAPDADLVTQTAYDGVGRTLSTTDVLGHRTWTAYDGLGRAIKTIANAVGTATDGGPNDPRSAVYTPSANPDQDILTTTTYDTNGYVLFTTNSLSIQTWFAYDSAGRQVKTIVNPTKTATDGSANDPRSPAYVPSALPDRDVITAGAYDPLGRVLYTIDPLGNRTWFAYDNLGRRVKTITNAVGTATDGGPHDPRSPAYVPSAAADRDLISTTVYDVAGRVTYSQDVMGVQTWFAYDGLGRRVKTIQNPVGTATDGSANDPRSASYLPSTLPDRDLLTTTVYDRAGRVQYTADSLGRRTWPMYDALGRVIRTIANAVGTALNGGVSDPRSASYNPVTDSDRDAITATSYDKAGRVVWTQDRFGRRTWNGYDALGRRIRVVANAIGTATDSSVNDPRNPFYAAKGNADQDLVTTTIYDKAGRVLRTTDALAIATAYRYDGLGRTVQSVANAVTSTFRATLPDQDLVTMTVYDKGGRTLATTAPDGQQTTFAYDSLGRRLTSTQAAGTTQASANYTCYDKAGHVLRTIQNYVALTGGISPDARDTRGNWLFSPVTHGTANDQNLMTSLTLDNAGRTLTVSDPLGNTRQTAYYKDGQVQSSADPLGVVTVYRYDAVRRRALTVQSYQASAGDPSRWVWNVTTARWEQGS